MNLLSKNNLYKSQKIPLELKINQVVNVAI